MERSEYRKGNAKSFVLKALPSGVDAVVGTKTPAPAGRAGGQWVELKLELPIELITVAAQ